MSLVKRKIKCNNTLVFNDTPPLEKQFQEIMECFDFRHVHMLMEWDKARVEYDDDGNHIEYHQWKMFNSEDGFCTVPTVDELKKDAERLLKEVIRLAKANPRCKFHMIGTGPFKAYYRYGIIELDCVFTDWSCD